MNIKLDCPVCGYKDVTGDICPNCDTDLALIRMLQELPPQPKWGIWQVAIALLMLLLGVALGIGSSLVFTPVQLNTVVVSHPRTVNPPTVTSQPLSTSTTYTVQVGDHLSAIATKLCGQETAWPMIVKANPQLIGREDNIEVGEVLKIPQCREGN